MVGFEIGQFSLEHSLERIEALKDLAVLPLDDEGHVVTDDQSAQESAREIRLLLQRVLDLNPAVFLKTMRGLYFHLFSADHEHYRDLLSQAALRNPEATRNFCLELLFSEEVVFIDDQKNLHDLFDVLQTLRFDSFPNEKKIELKNLLKRPFFRLPSLLARIALFVAPALEASDLPMIRELFQMDLIPKSDLTWKALRPFFAKWDLPAVLLEKPEPQPELFLSKVSLANLETLRWSLGIEGTPLSVAFRLLGCMVARGPEAADLFLFVSENQPETAFERNNFETIGQKLLFSKALDLLREEILREAHHSAAWFTEMAEEKPWPWMPKLAEDPWPLSLRLLGQHWGEFADPTDTSEFGEEAKEQVQKLDSIVDQLCEILRKHPLPTTEELQKGDELLQAFIAGWKQLLALLLPRLDILP